MVLGELWILRQAEPSSECRPSNGFFRTSGAVRAHASEKDLAYEIQYCTLFAGENKSGIGASCWAKNVGKGKEDSRTQLCSQLVRTKKRVQEMCAHSVTLDAHWSKYATAVDHALMYLGFA